jgi:hypothetical protein
MVPVDLGGLLVLLVLGEPFILRELTLKVLPEGSGD